MLRSFFAAVAVYTLVMMSLAHAAEPTKTVLYDGARNTGTPNSQGFLYQTLPIPPAGATQSFANGVTTLDTMPARGDMAGYVGRLTQVPQLDRTEGFKVRFTMQVVEEDHSNSDNNGDGVGDRAGFSVIVLSSDRKGVELGFWMDEAWAQDNGDALFTHAEGASIDTTAALATYDLTIQDATYTLSRAGAPVLSGPLRDYSVFGPPYTTPDFIFMGDDTSSARARVNITFVSVVRTMPDAPTYTLFLPTLIRT